MNTTTWAAIRSSIVGLIEDIDATTAHTDVSFARAPRRYELKKWVKNVGSAALRKFEVSRIGQVTDPAVQSPTHVQRNDKAKITVAYPALPALYGAEDLDDLEDIMRTDASQIRDAVFSQGNYLSGQHAAFVKIDEPVKTDTVWFQPLSVDLIYDESTVVLIYNPSVIQIAGGSNKAAEIQAAINALSARGGGTVELFEDTYTLETSLLAKSNVSIVGYGGRRATLSPISSWSGTADDPTNALIRITPALGSLSTTLSVAAPKGSTSLTLASVSGLAAGDYLRIQGHNTSGDQSYADSDGTGVTLTSLVKVASLPGGSVVNLTAPLLVYHGSGMAVQQITPVQHVKLANLDFSASGGSLASGVHVRSGLDIELVNLSAAGLSRAIVDLDHGSMDWEARDLYSRGEINGMVWLDSAHRGLITGLNGSPHGSRNHASGTPRGMVFGKNRPTDIQIIDCNLIRGCVGINFWGSHNLTIDNVVVADMNSQTAADRMDVLSTPETLSKLLAAGVNTGSSNVPVYGENHQNLKIKGVDIVGCRNHQEETGANGGCLFYLANALDFAVENCSLLNDEIVAPVPAGMYIDDCNRGVIDKIRFRGLNYCFRFRNQGLGSGVISNCYPESSAGVAVTVDFVFKFDYTSPGGGPTSLRVYNVKQGNFSTNVVGFGSSFADLGVQFIDCDFGQESSMMIAAKNVSGVTLSAGDHVTLVQPGSPDGLRTVTSGGGPSLLGGVVTVGGANNSYILYSPLPNRYNRVKCTTAAVKVGDRIVGSATARRFETNNAPASQGTWVGVALTDKAAGSEGLVDVGPV